MIDEVAAAFDRKDYHTAAKLLKQILAETPENLWAQLYLARLYEVSGKHEQAEKIYRQLLQLTTQMKVVSQARQGLQRLEAIKQAEKQKAISQAIEEPQNTELAVLVLEPVDSELKTTAAQKFAQIMEIDPYSARLVLPSRGWRIYRLGKLGELKFYGTQLQQAGIGCFWVKISQIQKIQVLQVKYFSASTPKAIVQCQNQENQLGSLTFDWSEVTAKVMGLLPIFEQVVDVNIRGKLERKTQTQDYAHFCDLHLPRRNTILRLYDNGYEFQQGVEIAVPVGQNTIRIHWNSLLNWLEQQLPQVKTWSDFKPFAETVLDQTDTLNHIPCHINLFRQEKSTWDSAFHLYSGLVLTKNMGLPNAKLN
jgi:hypothetical protein